METNETIVNVAGPLSKAAKPAAGATRIVRVRSTQEGFWRAGIKHTVAGTDLPVESLTDAEFDHLRGEPKLIVTVIDIVEAKKSEK